VERPCGEWPAESGQRRTVCICGPLDRGSIVKTRAEELSFSCIQRPFACLNHQRLQHQLLQNQLFQTTHRIADMSTEPEQRALEPDLEKQAPSPSDRSLDAGEKPLEAAPNEAAEASEAPGARVGLTLTQFWIVIAALNMGMLLTALDFNIVATAVPIISSEFQEYRNSSWLGTGFLVSFALVLPVYSKLGDMFGRKNMFLLGTIIFTLGSGLCGGSSSMQMLIASRVVQGIGKWLELHIPIRASSNRINAGAGGIYGLVNVIVTDLVPLREVGKYLALAGLVWAIADVAGPLMGGAFSQYVAVMSTSTDVRFANLVPPDT
jgi:hypothetical protein